MGSGEGARGGVASLKGFAFTSFALLASGVVLSAALFASSGGSDVEKTAEAQRISSASFFLDSFVSDSERSLRIATRRALTSATNFVAQNGEPLSNPAENISQVAVNGTLGDEEALGEAYVKEWESRSARLAEDSNYRLNVSTRIRNLSSNFLEIRANYTVETRLFDPVTLSRFRSTDNKTVTVSAEGLEDPMLLLRSSGRYVSSYTRCGFADPADMLGTGTQNSSSVFHGSAAVSPSDPSSLSNAGQKVLVVADVDDYSSQHSQNSVNDFGAVVSAEESENPESYSEHYVFGTGSNPGIGENESVTVYREQIWRTNFREMFQERCYIEDASGPGVLDRFENNADASGGVATLLDVSALPSEIQREDSAVGHEYFDSDQSTLEKIHGVTEYYPWFRLDQPHIQKYDLQELAY
jgi:hypothetical protein